MLDYIEITKHIQGKNKPFLGHLQPEAVYSSGMERYFVQGCRKMKIEHNPNTQSLKLKGSPLYFIQGHNFTYNKDLYIEGLKYIEDLLQMDLFDSDLDSFEYGIILEVEIKPKYIIAGHNAGQGFLMRINPKDRGGIRYFEDNKLQLKLYDAGMNIKHKQGMTMKRIIKEAGWNPNGNYLKVEAHYKEPHKLLNDGRAIRLADIFLPKWEERLKEDLLVQYQRLQPIKAIERPTNKSELSSADIILRRLAEDKMNQGIDLKITLYDDINSISENLMSIEDKKARKRQIKKMLERIETAPKSMYDLSDLLASALAKK